MISVGAGKSDKRLKSEERTSEQCKQCLVVLVDVRNYLYWGGFSTIQPNPRLSYRRIVGKDDDDDDDEGVKVVEIYHEVSSPFNRVMSAQRSVF